MEKTTEFKTFGKTLWRGILGLVKVVWSLAAIIIVGVVALCVVLIFVNTECDHMISNRLQLFKRGGIERYYLYDYPTRTKTATRIAYIDREFGADSLIRFTRKELFGGKELYGFIDARTGKVVIEPQFHYAGQFANGIAPVSRDGVVCLINRAGEVVARVGNGSVPKDSMVKRDDCGIVMTLCHKYGILSRSGEWLLAPEYHSVRCVKQGVYIVATEIDKWGVMQLSKGWIVEPIHQNIRVNKECTALIVTDNGLRWELDFDGNVVKPLVYDDLSQLFYRPMGDDSNEGVATQFFKFEIDRMYGVLNINTKRVLFPAVYKSVEMAAKDIFLLTSKDGTQSYLTYKSGEMVPIKR